MSVSSKCHSRAGGFPKSHAATSSQFMKKNAMLGTFTRMRCKCHILSSNHHSSRPMAFRFLSERGFVSSISNMQNSRRLLFISHPSGTNSTGLSSTPSRSFFRISSTARLKVFLPQSLWEKAGKYVLNINTLDFFMPSLMPPNQTLARSTMLRSG